ncbi:hypothetical protein INT45_012544 [Circinella minor]|uniref:Uncharacterized protein n=1 Tax=Circinella minor TaxID=1195481 RepID=A0A8H7VIL3_9FUNG|nr:hypothetical protein INT45_012544 [Circinella minor]
MLRNVKASNSNESIKQVPYIIKVEDITDVITLRGFERAQQNFRSWINEKKGLERLRASYTLAIYGLKPPSTFRRSTLKGLPAFESVETALVGLSHVLLRMLIRKSILVQ